MRTFALLISGLLATVLAGCESSDTVAATCGYDDGNGNIVFLYASEFGGDADAANDACVDRAPDGNVDTDNGGDADTDADADADADTDTDDGGNSGGETDYDGDGDWDGYEDPVMAIGSYMYGHISIMPSGADEYYLFGYGFTGTDDWCEERHETEKVTIDGETWFRGYLVNYQDEYRLNFGTEDVCASNDFTRWAYILGEAKDDPFAWQNEGDGSWALCATHDDEQLIPANCDSNDD